MQDKLSKVELELAELDEVHGSVERSARRKANALLVGGFFILVSQTVAMIYLTW